MSINTCIQLTYLFNYRKCYRFCVTYMHTCNYLFTQVTDYLVDPLCRGVFASSPKSLSLRSCFPLFHQYESKYGSIVMGLFRDSEGVVQSCNAWWIVGEDSSGMHLGMEGGAVFFPLAGCLPPPPEIHNVIMNYEMQYMYMICRKIVCACMS